VTGEPVAFDDLPVALLEVRGTTIVAATDLARSLMGTDTGDPIGTDLVASVGPDDRLEVTRLLLPATAPDRGLTATASEAPAGVRVRMGPPPGRPILLTRSSSADRVLVALEDQQAVRQLSAVIDAVADSTLLLDADGQLIWQSDALAVRVPTGLANVGSHPVERLHPEDLPLVLESFAELAGKPTGRVSRVVRSRAVDQDDVWQLIELVGAGRAGHPDLGGIVVQVRNLDQGAEVESLAHTDGPLLSLAEAAPIGILLMDRQQHVVFANRSGRDLLGSSDGDDVSDWRDRVKPTHRAAVDALVADGLRGAEAVTITAPAVLADGVMSWFRIRVAPHIGTRQQVIGVIAALEDVTAEVEARTESERLMHMLDATSDFVAIFRPSGEILHANAALRHVLDRLRDEGGRGAIVDLMSADLRERFIANAYKNFEESDTSQGELEIEVGGGETMAMSVLAVVQRDDEGELDWIAMVARDISELKEAEAGLRRMATVDHLTGLANRALFTEHLEAVVANNTGTGRPVAVLFCDLDQFKAVNDQHGHAVGDAVLVTVADRLREMTRGTDMAARVGGDEFVVLCEGVTSVDSLASLAERIIESVRLPIDVGSELGTEPVQVGISIGVALARRVHLDGDRLLINADQAMYRAKATGGNRYRIHVIDGS
jgi:diguanylate cyclase (GGDEF)-like protein/PAS domain S-box-containing protein